MSKTDKQSTKHAIATVITLFFVIGAMAWFLKPNDGGWPLVVFCAITVGSAIMTISYIRETLMKTLCTSCDANIFPFINLGKHLKLDIKYCPKCGCEFEI